MSQPQGTLYEIRWNEIFPWLILARALRVSLMARVLALSLVGVLLTQWGWSAIDLMFSENSAQLEQLTDLEKISTLDELKRSSRFSLDEAPGPLIGGWNWIAQPFTKLFDQDASWRRCLALLLCGSWSIAVWALFGGAITRTSAVYLTRGETLGPREALKSALVKWVAFAGAPFIVLLSVVVLALPLIIDGFLMRSDFLAMLAGALWVLVLIWGLLLSVVLLGFLFGWPLMWATVSVERTDAFDGVSRCFAYVSQRPLHLVFYLVVSTVLGVLGSFLVHGVAIATTELSEWTISWGAGGERTAELVGNFNAIAADSLDSLTNLRVQSILFWKWVLQSLAASYSVGYLWSASVGIYLLLRRHIDSTELEEIGFDEGETPQEGLPELEPDETGVPQMAEKNADEEE